jgi:hypothetical protein
MTRNIYRKSYCSKIILVGCNSCYDALLSDAQDIGYNENVSRMEVADVLKIHLLYLPQCSHKLNKLL